MKLMIDPQDKNSLIEAKLLICKANDNLVSGGITDGILEQLIANNETLSEIDYLLGQLK